MKILYKTIGLSLLAGCFCLLLTGPTIAKVCFVGEPNCSGGGNFGEYQPNDNGKLCITEGYDTSVDACRFDPHKEISAYCPYNKEYVMCCGKEYAYNTPCVYPLITKGRCGNKYKCECDPSQYKYTDKECRTIKGSAGEGFENSYGSGASCMQMSYVDGKVKTEIKFSSCQCDRGVYPKRGGNSGDCDNNAEKNGPCSTKYSNSNATELYYKFCRCNSVDYPKTDAGCYPLTGDAKRETCFDTIMHYKSCANCDGYKARNLDHVAYDQFSKPIQCTSNKNGLSIHNCDYEVCPYDQTGNTFFKIKRCNEPGYQAKADGSGCEPIACKDAVKIFIKEKGSEYGIFDGNNFLDANGQQSKAKKAIVASNITVSGVGTIQSSSSVIYEIVCIDIRCAPSSEHCYSYDKSYISIPLCYYGQTACCKEARMNERKTTVSIEGELGKSTALAYYSPSYVATGSSDGEKAIRVACADTSPTITYSGSSFPMTSNKEMVLYGLNLRFSAQSTGLNRPLKIYNGLVTVNTLIAHSHLTLINSTSRPNAKNAKVKGGNLSFYNGSKLYTESYDFEIGDIFFNNGTGENNIWYPNSFVANKLYTRGVNTNVALHGGKYYIVRLEAGWSKEGHENNVYLHDNAVYYMYSKRSNNHSLTAMGCGAFRVQVGSVVQAQTWSTTDVSYKSCRYKSKQGNYSASNAHPGGNCDKGTCWQSYNKNKCSKHDDC